MPVEWVSNRGIGEKLKGNRGKTSGEWGNRGKTSGESGKGGIGNWGKTSGPCILRRVDTAQVWHRPNIQGIILSSRIKTQAKILKRFLFRCISGTCLKFCDEHWGSSLAACHKIPSMYRQCCRFRSIWQLSYFSLNISFYSVWWIQALYYTGSGTTSWFDNTLINVPTGPTIATFNPYTRLIRRLGAVVV